MDGIVFLGVVAGEGSRERGRGGVDHGVQSWDTYQPEDVINLAVI